MSRKHEILTVLLLSAAPAAASPDHRMPPPDAQVPKALRDLRVELAEAGRAKALGQLPKFRALCDQDGYPLVGNLAGKGDIYHPSQFCAELRKPAKRS